jgi:hypothetical protein
MKAKEYAERYKAEGSTNEAVAKVWMDMFNEVYEICKIRHAKTDAATVAVVYEIDNKWKAFARLAGPEIKPDGFMGLLQYRCPDLWEAIKIYEIVKGGRK